MRDPQFEDAMRRHAQQVRVLHRDRARIGRISPEITRISVVLPAPFGPITATASPEAISTETPNSAWKPS